MRRRVASVVSVAVIVVVLSPAWVERDSYPLSTYPMFSYPRDRTAVVEPDGTILTYAELDRRSDRLACFLASRGIETGDRVGVVLPKSLQAVISLFGIMKAGAAYVPVDWTAPPERGRRILEDCRVRAVIIDERFLATAPE